MLNKIILFVVNQYSVIMQRNCPWLFMFAENFSNREAERNRPRPRIQRLPATHLKLIERARSNQGNTVIVSVCSRGMCSISLILLVLVKDGFVSFSEVVHVS